MERSTFVIDIDDTISVTEVDENGVGQYLHAKPITEVIRRIQELYRDGHKIILFTARGMRTFKGNIKEIENFHKENLINWLGEHDVPYDELCFGKPWGHNVYYIDDRNLTISQFVNNPPERYLKDTKLNRIIV